MEAASIPAAIINNIIEGTDSFFDTPIPSKILISNAPWRICAQIFFELARKTTFKKSEASAGGFNFIQ